MKNEDDVKPEKTTIHPSNNNNAAEVHEEKSAESQQRTYLSMTRISIEARTQSFER